MRSRHLVVAGTAAVLFALAAPMATLASGRMSVIVVLKDPVARPRAVAEQHSRRFGADVTYVYRHALKGYAAHIDGRELGALRADRRVAYVERDGRVRISATQSNPPSWGLDRIDDRNLPLDASFVSGTTASNVTAYVIDTGIRTTHSDFGGRARSGYDFVDDDGNASDCNGHGTHVAGTIGGASHGVAKGVSLVAVRVLDCGGSGFWSGVIAGLDWVVADHGSGAAVANMSLGGGANSAVDAAVDRVIQDGVTVAVAAGNSNADACRYSPARVANAITVGATTSSDARASYSNYGKCLDLFAPGSSIRSAWSTSDTATNTISGTSMATPHVAGVAALYLAGNPGASPAAVASALTGNASAGKVGGMNRKVAGSTPNLLLYTDY
jgi:subtilisin family serine protease